jgi:hypothetical protein
VSVEVGVSVGGMVGLGVFVTVGVGVVVGDEVVVGVFVQVGVADTRAASTRGRWSRSLAGNKPITTPIPAHMIKIPNIIPIIGITRVGCLLSVSTVSIEFFASFVSLMIARIPYLNDTCQRSRLSCEFNRRCVMIGIDCVNNKVYLSHAQPCLESRIINNNNSHCSGMWLVA